MFRENIIWLDTVDSTNTRLKELADRGADEGTVVIAGEQTAGRGTGGRTFFSPGGEGLYLSVLLRPKAELQELFTLTGWAAVAVRDGIEAACGAPCRIKWLNDIWLNGKKLCGILTELSPVIGAGADYLVLGVGINVSQTRERFEARGLGEIATSLAAEGYPVTCGELAEAVLGELERMYRGFPREKEEYLRRYRTHCLTIGRQVGYRENGTDHEGTAAGVDEDFALLVDGRTVRSGTVYLTGERDIYEQYTTP